MIKHIWSFVVVLAVSLFVPVSPVAAQTVLVSNLEHARISGTVMDGTDSHRAAAFTNDGAAHLLHSFDVHLEPNGGSTSGHVFAALRAANPDGTVGALLSSFGAATDLGDGIFRFVPLATFQLAASTTYWVTLWENGPGTVVWTFPNTTAYSGTGTLPADKVFAQSGDGGNTWAGYLPLSSRPQHLRVNIQDEVPAPSVPEPGSLLLFVPALGIVAALRRRR